MVCNYILGVQFHITYTYPFLTFFHGWRETVEMLILCAILLTLWNHRRTLQGYSRRPEIVVQAQKKSKGLSLVPCGTPAFPMGVTVSYICVDWKLMCIITAVFCMCIWIQFSVLSFYLGYIQTLPARIKTSFGSPTICAKTRWPSLIRSKIHPLGLFFRFFVEFFRLFYIVSTTII